MKNKKGLLTFVMVSLVIILAGCNYPLAGGANNGNPSAFYTQAAETIVAQLTYSVVETFVSQKTIEAMVTPTPTTAPPTETPLIPTQTPTATSTPKPPTSTPIPVPCNALQFIADVSIEDGELVSANQGFYKIWRLRNVGTCTWTTDYDLVFVDGDRMSGQKIIPLEKKVFPGESIDLSVYLTAPEDKGEYTGYWMLRSDSGSYFGYGPNFDQAFWVHIEVKKSAPSYYDTPFSFYSNYCLADWSNGSSPLPCPGSSSSEDGYVIYLKNPNLEKGGVDDEPAIWVHPEFIKNGEITGEFPPILIQDGDHLITTIGCLKDQLKCNVDFEISYRADGGALTSLGEWNEVYDKTLTHIDEDLSALKDQEVVFYFTVTTNGTSFSGDEAFWLAPSIK